MNARPTERAHGGTYNTIINDLNMLSRVILYSKIEKPPCLQGGFGVDEKAR
jgi:hypothetical protein